jgi:hypothetical protein
MTRWGERWTPEMVRERDYKTRKCLDDAYFNPDSSMKNEGDNNESNNHNFSVSTSDLEPAFGDESMGTEKGERLDKKCRIHIHSRTKRLADADGRSGKAAIDGIVLAGILPNDNPKYVKEVSHSQEKVFGKEETIITIIWED